MTSNKENLTTKHRERTSGHQGLYLTQVQLCYIHFSFKCSICALLCGGTFPVSQKEIWSEIFSDAVQIMS